MTIKKSNDKIAAAKEAAAPVKTQTSVMMSMASLKDMGLFVSSEPVKTEIAWNNGTQDYTFFVYIKRHSFGVVEKMFTAKEDSSSMSRYIADSVQIDDGGELRYFTFEEAKSLEPSIARAFLDAISRVNSKPKTKK